VASDVAGDAIAAARANAAAAGVEAFVDFALADARSVTPPADAGILVANPPYGVRLGSDEALHELYAGFADNLKRRFAGWSAWLLVGDPALVKAIRLSPSRRIPLYNGALECRLLEYRMVAGSNRRGGAESPAGDGKIRADQPDR
jgi:putative N6-adenine-specific DNA methylase